MTGAMHSLSPMRRARSKTTQSASVHPLASGVPGDPPGYFGVPIVEWARPTVNAIGTQFHLDQSRWVDFRASLEVNVTHRFPLIDANNIPFVDPAIPPMTTVLFDATGTYTGTPIDEDAIGRMGTSVFSRWSEIRAIPPEFTYYAACDVSFKPATSPVPHWVMEVQITSNDPADVGAHVAVSMISNGCSETPAADLNVAGGWGDWALQNGWGGHSFMTASDRDILNQRQMVSGILNSGTQITFGTTHQTRLVDAGGTNQVLDSNAASAGVSMWRMMRHIARNVTPATAADWAASSYGQGQHDYFVVGVPVPPWHSMHQKYGHSIVVTGYDLGTPFEPVATVALGPGAPGGSMACYMYALGLRDSGSTVTVTHDGLDALWTLQTAGTANYNELAKVHVLGELSDSRSRVHLTDTGEPGGTSLFAAGTLPWIEVMAADEADPSRFTSANRSGPSYTDGVLTTDMEGGSFYYNLLRSDNAAVVPTVSGAAHWMIELYPRGVLEGGSVAAHGRRRPMVVHALGEAA